MFPHVVTLRTRLNQWKHYVAPSTTLIGKGEDGKWRTARVKEYPLRLSAAIGFAMADSVCRTPISPFTYDPETIFAAIAPFKPILDPYLFPTDLGADYVASTEPVHRFLAQWAPPHAVSFSFTN